MAKEMQEGFDATYKASPNRIDRNEILRCIEKGMTAQEIAMAVKVKVKSVEMYFPKEEQKSAAKTGAK